jgi:hypothetical protein
MTRTYADICLESAEKATNGPWIEKNDWYIEKPNGIRLAEAYDVRNIQFIAHARTDVPELSRRLKRACDALRMVCVHSDFSLYKDLADELESISEEK